MVTNKEFEDLKMIVADLQKNVVVDDVVLDIVNILHQMSENRDTMVRKVLLPNLIKKLGCVIHGRQGVVRFETKDSEE